MVGYPTSLWPELGKDQEVITAKVAVCPGLNRGGVCFDGQPIPKGCYRRKLDEDKKEDEEKEQEDGFGRPRAASCECYTIFLWNSLLRA